MISTESGRLDLNQRSRASEARDHSGLVHVPQNQSTQRESNPRIYHGKVAGYRYIMGATLQWAGRCSNPRLRFFKPPLRRLSYQPKDIRSAL